MSSGALRFVRYAFPPSELGYCGPEDHEGLLDYERAGVVDGGLLGLIRDFEGAWPYLELIGDHAGLDPLDDRVVSAYWTGAPLPGKLRMTDFASSLNDRFAKRAGASWDRIGEAVGTGVAPHHGFHVFCIYPWVGLMRSGLGSSQPLAVLENCRIRWGRVVSNGGASIEVESRPLQFDGDRIFLGDLRHETVRWHGQALTKGVMVTMHWGWACEAVGESTGLRLLAQTKQMIDVANRTISRPGVGVLA